MSADNGVYILSLRDCCFIKEIKGIDRIYDSASGKLIPKLTYLEFKNSVPAADMNEATQIATEILKGVDYCEKGIVVIPVDKKWDYFKRKGAHGEHRRFSRTDKHLPGREYK